MPRRKLMIPALVVCALTAGCAKPPPPAAISFQPITAFDGVYRGQIRIKDFAEGGDRGSCEIAPQITLYVHDGAFTYAMPHPNVPGNLTLTYTAYLDADGSFRGQAGVMGNMAGRVIGNRIEGLIEGSGCDYLFAASRA